MTYYLCEMVNSQPLNESPTPQMKDYWIAGPLAIYPFIKHFSASNFRQTISDNQFPASIIAKQISQVIFAMWVSPIIIAFLLHGDAYAVSSSLGDAEPFLRSRYEIPIPTRINESRLGAKLGTTATSCVVTPVTTKK